MSLTHLKQLEAESIYIFREVFTEFEKPVMLYSIGKDSSVLLHLARKAFYPGKIPFPLLHVDTNWKFKEMIAFRDQCAKKYGFGTNLNQKEGKEPMPTSKSIRSDKINKRTNPKGKELMKNKSEKTKNLTRSRRF